MAWLHTWSGLLVGWVLFAVFLTGTAAYLRPEISYWMRPELSLSRSGPRNAEVAMAAMQALAPDSPSWFITLPDGRETTTRVFRRDPAAAGRRFRDAVLDADTGQRVATRDTVGGEFFYRFHFQLHYVGVLWGRWIMSVCTMFMLVAIISGIITHRRIFADVFTFRPGKGQRSWLDGHNICAVLALPYHLMITYTGLVLFMLMVRPWGIERVYPGQRAAFNTEAFGNAPPRPRSGVHQPLVNIAPLLDEAQRHWPGSRIGRIVVTNPGDARATIQIIRLASERISYNPQSLAFDGVTGALLQGSNSIRPAAEVRGVMYGLHIGRFAGPLLRTLFVLSGLAGTLMVATGCLLWTVKQRQQAARSGRTGFGTRLAEHLNIAVIAGLPLSMAVFFWASRALPLDMPRRAEWEVHLFVIAWSLCFLHPLLRSRQRAWADQFAIGGVAFMLLPVANAFLTQRHLLATMLGGDIVRAGFDLGLLAWVCWVAARCWRCCPGEQDGNPRPPLRSRNANATAPCGLHGKRPACLDPGLRLDVHRIHRSVSEHGAAPGTGAPPTEHLNLPPKGFPLRRVPVAGRRPVSPRRHGGLGKRVAALVRHPERGRHADRDAAMLPSRSHPQAGRGTADVEHESKLYLSS
ncbi:PepSY domain-containing protein [Roseomonas vastitatis]|uniref:PepSY domain-containing protein n=1 Tax=Teichococcus vastitatis TaxID=2307076 RepID=A0ABS9W9E1_9PROT|nr:PepSY-associated TM helix domain-containing protein [Pseudoroseomonas vastitatis]MCI0755852.1 PepSY domain-containing protein [Pseudoroseomonas vastitatis]